MEAIEYLMYFLIVYAIVIVFAIYWFVIRGRGKLKVRVKTPTGERVIMVKPQDDGETLIIEKERKRGNKTIGWKATFTRNSIVRIKGRFGTKDAVDILYHAPKAIEYDYEAKDARMPHLDFNEIKKVVDVQVFQKKGEGEHLALPPIFWMILIAVGINTVLSVLIARGLGIF